MGSTWQSSSAQQDYEAAQSMLQHSRAGRNVQYSPLNGYQPSDPSNYVQQPPQSLRTTIGGLQSSHGPSSPTYPASLLSTQPTPSYTIGNHSNFLPPPDVRRAETSVSLPKLYSQSQASPLQSPLPPNYGHTAFERKAQSYHVSASPITDTLDSRGAESRQETYYNGEGEGDVDEDASIKEDPDETEEKPAWAFEKTKAGKERKRLPLACIACRRKKIRCSGEKPSCKHCIRAKMPCVFKVTTRKAAPRTDYMAMLDRRLKRMEERIIRISPKNGTQDRKIPRAAIRPFSARDSHGIKKRDADEAFDTQVEDWVKSKPHPHSYKSQKPQEHIIFKDGLDQLPPKDIQMHLSEVFFDYVYGQSYHIMHRPSYMRKLHSDELPPVLVLAVCAIAARFSNHPKISMEPAYLRGEEWAAPARRIALKHYDEPNIPILTVLVILGLHEFGTCQGGRSWIFAGMAIRMAHALQLHRELDHDPVRKQHGNPAEFNYTDREVRRRAMWACFMMDRFTASGTERPMYTNEEEIKVHLPIEERKFNAGLSGPTETLSVPTSDPSAILGEQATIARANMGVAAYMVRTIALWGHVIKYENMGGKEKDKYPMWSHESHFHALKKRALDLKEHLPASLSYTPENLQSHASAWTANQLIFLHVALNQIDLFLHRFAIAANPNTQSADDMPLEFHQRAFDTAINASVEIASLLANALDYRTVAPFMGYCAFTSSTVLAWAVFFGDKGSQPQFYRSLAQNLRYLRSLKRYWGVLHFMAKTLREIYARNKENATSGEPSSSDSNDPIHQYGDWFDKFPRGVDHPSEDHPKIEEDDATKMQLSAASDHHDSDKRIVEDFFNSLGGVAKVPPKKKHRKPPKLTQQYSRRTSQTQTPSATPHEHNQIPLPPNIHSSEQIHHLQSPFTVPSQNYATSQQPTFQVPFPPANFEPTIEPGNTSLIPQLDRQIVYGAYAGQDAKSTTATLDLNAMTATTSSQQFQPGAAEMWNGNTPMDLSSGQPMMMSPGDEFLGDYNSTAWFMPFNLQPPGDGNYGGQG